MSLRATALFDLSGLLLAATGRDGRVHDDITQTGVGHAVAVRGADFDRFQVGQDAHHVFASDDRAGVQSTPSRLPQWNGVRLSHRLNCIVNRFTKVEMKKERIPLSLQIGFDWGGCRPTRHAR